MRSASVLSIATLAAFLLMTQPLPSQAAHPLVKDVSEGTEWEMLQQIQDAGGSGPFAMGDTIWFGGSGTGNGTVTRGGIWNWESSSGEAPVFFPDGDPVGNQYRDGWTFMDGLARRGPSPVGAGHWDPNGAYNFDNDNGSFAHRATFHPNNGINDGPPPLNGSWSIWIGTNLYLNPEHCGWSRTAGYGDGWSQGIVGTVPGNSTLTIRHRYAVEQDFDYCVVEQSQNGLTWTQLASFNGGDRAHPQPSPSGDTFQVGVFGAGPQLVRFRLLSEGFYSDASEGGDYFYGWQIDDIEISGGALYDFETSMGIWQPKAFEGPDRDITSSTTLPAGRIEKLVALTCEPQYPGTTCPEACSLENRVLLFTDRHACGLHNASQLSFAVSPTLPIRPLDLMNHGGRLFQTDFYADGGIGTFETGLATCFVYSPSSAAPCPYTPAGGAPGAGSTYAWSQTSSTACKFFSNGVGADCIDDFQIDVSDAVPPEADSVIVMAGVFSQCQSYATCDPNDRGAPFLDNLRFGVYRSHKRLFSATSDRYSDSFPIDSNILTSTTRSDGAHSLSQNLGIENPMRWVRSDSAVVVDVSDPDVHVYLRFRVTASACQPELAHPFFIAYPPGQWHEALMEPARAHGTGQYVPGRYMTCYGPGDPYDGTYWTGTPPANEPCDDILPDGLFTAGTVVHYFFEERTGDTGVVIATFPSAQNGPIGTAANYQSYWLETTSLPELINPGGSGCRQAHSMLVVNDYETQAVPGLGTVMRDRLTNTLSSLGLDFDVYDCVGTSVLNSYNGIGRREDRSTQAPRPPLNGATQRHLDNYDVIWYSSGLDKANTLSDRTTSSFFGGQPSEDQQKLENWIGRCDPGFDHLLVLEGAGWASDIAAHTNHGPAFLNHFGAGVLSSSYREYMSNLDLRRCTRVSSIDTVFGEIFGSGCPDRLPIDVLNPVGSGIKYMQYLNSFELESAPVDCNDDEVQGPAAVIRQSAGDGDCRRSVAMGFPYAFLYPPNCTDECEFDDWIVNGFVIGGNANFIIDIFNWANQPINPAPVGVGDASAVPVAVNRLDSALPNPANPSATIRYSIARRGRVQLKIYDVSGRLVRELVDGIQNPEADGYTAVWDGKDDNGKRMGSGVYLYQITAPDFSAARKLVLLK